MQGEMAFEILSYPTELHLREQMSDHRRRLCLSREELQNK